MNQAITNCKFHWAFCEMKPITLETHPTGYEDDIFETISNLHNQGSKFGRKFYKFGGKSF